MEVTFRWLKDTLDNYLSALETEIKVDKALLFGSYAKGETYEWSDIGLWVHPTKLESSATSFSMMRFLRQGKSLI